MRAVASRHALHPRGAWLCVLRPLEAAAEAMGDEAAALLPEFSVQPEAIGVPRGGWRELALLPRCAAA